MDTESLTINYINALDKYREMPDTANRDYLHEAEYSLRAHLNLSIEQLETIYKVR